MNAVYFAYGFGFLAVVLFTWVGIVLFGRGWQTYEQQYVRGAEKSLGALYLTIPAQHILYLSFLAAFFLLGGVLVLTSSFFLSVAAGVLGSVLPKGYLAYLKRKRAIQFERQIPDLINTLANGLKAGCSVGVGLELARRQMKPPMSQELSIVLQEMRLGETQEMALRNLHCRMQSDDLELLIMALVASERVGGNVGKILSSMERTIRERTKMEGKLKALSSQGKLESIVVAVIPVVMILAFLVLAPTFILPFFTTPIGLLLFALMVFWNFCGFYVLRMILSVRF